MSNSAKLGLAAGLGIFIDGFLLVYLLTLIKQSTNSISMPVLVFVAIFFFLIIYNAHVYHFNPLRGIFGYHFYEATIEGDITFVLITRQSITHCKSISRVVQLTEYMILDVNHARYINLFALVEDVVSRQPMICMLLKM